jgi:hypothetical protein
VKVCGHNYRIDVANARFFYEFSKSYIPKGSIFLGNSYFHSTGDSIVITSYLPHENTPQKEEVTIPKCFWNLVTSALMGTPGLDSLLKVSILTGSLLRIRRILANPTPDNVKLVTAIVGDTLGLLGELDSSAGEVLLLKLRGLVDSGMEGGLSSLG